MKYNENSTKHHIARKKEKCGTKRNILETRRSPMDNAKKTVIVQPYNKNLHNNNNNKEEAHKKITKKIAKDIVRYVKTFVSGKARLKHRSEYIREQRSKKGTRRRRRKVHMINENTM